MLFHAHWACTGFLCLLFGGMKNALQGICGGFIGGFDSMRINSAGCRRISMAKAFSHCRQIGDRGDQQADTRVTKAVGMLRHTEPGGKLVEPRGNHIQGGWVR